MPDYGECTLQTGKCMINAEGYTTDKFWGLRGCGSGCLSNKWSLVVLPSDCTWESFNGLPLPCSVISLVAALMLPAATSLSKALTILPASLSPWCWLVSRPWIVRPSSSSSSIAPACHFASLSPREFEWSLHFDFALGFCNRRIGRTIAAFCP